VSSSPACRRPICCVQNRLKARTAGTSSPTGDANVAVTDISASYKQILD
jgi:hypothetical protein